VRYSWAEKIAIIRAEVHVLPCPSASTGFCYYFAIGFVYVFSLKTLFISLF